MVPMRPATPLLMLWLAACSSTTTVLREETGRARLQVSSQPYGALLTTSGLRPGRTPLTIEVPLKRVERVVSSAEWKRGWWALVTGALAAGAGAAAVTWGAENIGNHESSGPVVALSLGWMPALYGAVALVAGIYTVIVQRPRRVVAIEPSVVPLDLRFAGLPAAQAELVLTPGALTTSGRVHFGPSSWSGSLSPAASLRVLRAPYWREPAVVVDAKSAEPARAAPPSQPPVSTAPDLALLQDLRQQGEVCYRRRDYRCAVAKFERALALVPTAAMRFNLASAQDKLGEAVLAIRQYRRYLEDAGRSVSPTALVHIQRRMKQLLPKVGRLQLTPPDNARISIDGIELRTLEPAFLEGGRMELVLEPGLYRIDVSVPARPVRNLRVELKPRALQTIELGH